MKVLTGFDSTGRGEVRIRRDQPLTRVIMSFGKYLSKDIFRDATVVLHMLSDQLKRAIAESGKTAYQIGQETGVPQSVLSRFLSDNPDQHRDIRLEGTADKLASYLGLELRLVEKAPKKDAKRAKAAAPPRK
jgi:hypothetical protein